MCLLKKCLNVIKWRFSKNHIIITCCSHCFFLNFQGFLNNLKRCLQVLSMLKYSGMFPDLSKLLLHLTPSWYYSLLLNSAKLLNGTYSRPSVSQGDWFQDPQIPKPEDVEVSCAIWHTGVSPLYRNILHQQIQPAQSQLVEWSMDMEGWLYISYMILQIPIQTHSQNI